MLAISAAVAVMLTACGGGSDGASGAAGANGDNGANVTGNGTNPTPAGTTKPAVGARINRNGDTVTVELVDADGNAVPVPAGSTVPAVKVNGNDVTPTVTQDGKLQFDAPSGENGFKVDVPDVTDPSTGAPFTTTVPGVRFKDDGKGGVTVELTDATGALYSGSPQTGVTSAITNTTSADLSSGYATVSIDKTDAGAVPFTLTNPDGSTFTGIVDTGSYTDDNGYYLLGCNDSFPIEKDSHTDAGTFTIFLNGSPVTTAVDEQDPTPRRDLNSGDTYSYEFKVKYFDSTGTTVLTNVSRNVKVKIMAGEASGSLVDIDSTPIELPMTNGEGTLPGGFIPIKNTAADKYKPTPAFVLRMTDYLCVKKKPGAFYDRVFNVVTP